jgi:UDP-N-acetylglucosamine 2-epimerase (non-hydrolysing)
MKKILTIAWTRPDIIRLSEIIKKLDIHTKHYFAYTWQNFDDTLYKQFFSDLSLRKPDFEFNIKEQLSGFPFIWQSFIDIDNVLEKVKPDCVLILWDTNSALTAYVAKRKGIPVFHMEAWNRCYSDEVPEEINRRIIDSVSEYLLPYTQRSREQLLREGYHPSKIIVTWNPISEIVSIYLQNIQERIIKEDYVLVTLHRQENIINEKKLKGIALWLNEISKQYKVILSVHPKLKDMVAKFQIKFEKNVELSKPFSFKKFLNLEKYAKCVLSDSGTVPEECCILKTPCVQLRTTTERPELLENNSMILSWITKEEIMNSFEVAIKTSIWEIPDDYKDTNISEKIVKIILRHI